MSKSRIGFTLLAACLLGCGNLLHAAPPPTAEQMLQFKPRQDGTPISTPSAAELAGCKVELIKGQKLANGKTASGWLLRDPQGRPLRRFYDSDGDNQIDVWSYYLNGEECYREMDTNFTGKPDQYRWLGANGSKWGVDLNKDGVIDAWRVISPEEVSQEILAAVTSKNFVRLQALMINKADLDSLELPESEAARIKAKVQTATAAFQATTTALAKLSSQTKWVHLELEAPECVPADALSGKADLTHYKHGTILYGDGEANDFLQTGELIQVGRAWRIVEAPTPGGVSQNATPNGPGASIAISEDIKKFVEQLKVVDDKYKSASLPAELAKYNMERGSVLESIIGALKTKEEREDWIKQMADCYSTAAQHGDQAALAKLNAWVASLAKTEAKSSNLLGYLAYCEMSADYAKKLADSTPSNMAKLQDEWKDRLAKFVQDFPTAENAPDAMMQLGMVNEFAGKETEAKNWYGEIVKNFPKSPYMPKAQGAVRRLTCEGKDFDLSSKVLGAGTAFEIKNLHGKMVVVYYWASWNTQCAADFAKIKQLLAKVGPKGVELVCVNLDSNPAEAIKFLKANPIAGTQLYEAGGQDSPPAVNYGIMVLPHTFVIDVNGKVVSRNAQVATLEDEFKALTK